MEVSSYFAKIRYLPYFQIPSIAARYLGKPLHCLGPKIHDTYKQHYKNQQLVWSVASHALNDYKRAARVPSLRRTRIAFSNELAKHGLNEVGTRIRDPGEDEPPGDLRGSLVILLHRECLTHSLPSVQKEIGELLDSLLWKLKHQRQEMEENLAKRQARRDARKEAKMRALRQADEGRNASSVQ